MPKEITILIAEDDEGHAILIKRNLTRAGISNELIHFGDGQEIVNFLFRQGSGPQRCASKGYVLLLDIRMPKIDGIEVLRRIKNDPQLCKMPVVMLTTTDNPAEVDRCHEIGCNSYIAKPVDYENFVNAMRQLGLFLSIVEVPRIKT